MFLCRNQNCICSYFGYCCTYRHKRCQILFGTYMSYLVSKNFISKYKCYIYIYFNGPVFFLLCPQFLYKACKMFSVIRKDRIDATFCCFCLKFKIFFGKICSIFNRKCGRKTALSLSRKHDMMAIILYIV